MKTKNASAISAAATPNQLDAMPNGLHVIGEGSNARLVFITNANAAPVVSSTGKTKLIGSASEKTDMVVEGQPVRVSFSAYFKN